MFVVDADYAVGRDRHRRGMSSLHERSGGPPLAAVVQVPTVRLDELLATESLDDGPIALWIDAEGMGFEVIRGGSGLLRSTRMIHVEVETKPVIGANQKVFSDIERMLIDAGFELFATDQRRDVLQFNALFLRAETLRTKVPEILRYARRERLLCSLSRPIIRLIPGRWRVALNLRLGETRRH